MEMLGSWGRGCIVTPGWVTFGATFGDPLTRQSQQGMDALDTGIDKLESEEMASSATSNLSSKPQQPVTQRLWALSWKSAETNAMKVAIRARRYR